MHLTTEQGAKGQQYSIITYSYKGSIVQWLISIRSPTPTWKMTIYWISKSTVIKRTHVVSYYVGTVVKGFTNKSPVKWKFWTYAIQINMDLNMILLPSVWNKLCFFMRKNNTCAFLSHPGRIIETLSSKFLFILWLRVIASFHLCLS